MMRTLAYLVLFAALMGPVRAEDAPQSVRIPRVGYLATHATWTRYFHAAMKDLGYLEGKNLVVVWRLSDEKSEHLASAAQELVGLDVDIIFVDSTPAALAAKSATNRIPIVFAGLVDPIGTGLVASLAKPGGNVTGTTIITRDVTAKRVELLKEAVPTVAMLAIFWNPTHPHGPAQAKDAQAAATQAGLKAHLVPVRSAQEIDAAFATLANRPYGLLITDDTLLINQIDRLASLAIERRLPGISGFRTFAEGGGPHVVRAEPGGAISRRRPIRRPNHQGCTTRRSAGQTTNQVRSARQPENGAGAEVEGPRVYSAARR